MVKISEISISFSLLEEGRLKVLNKFKVFHENGLAFHTFLLIDKFAYVYLEQPKYYHSYLINKNGTPIKVKHSKSKVNSILLGRLDILSNRDVREGFNDLSSSYSEFNIFHDDFIDESCRTVYSWYVISPVTRSKIETAIVIHKYNNHLLLVQPSNDMNFNNHILIHYDYRKIKNKLNILKVI